MMATNQTERVMELLKRFNNGEKVCIQKLRENADAEGSINLWYQDNYNNKNKDLNAVSEKTIRRDLDVISKHFPESFELIRGSKGEKGCYKAVTKQAFDNFMAPETLSLMALTFSMASKSELFDNFNLSDDDRKIIEKELKSINKVYEFKNKPFETSKTDNKILKALEHSIKYQKCVYLEYDIGSEYIKMEVKPYKILFINENFYVACEMEDTIQFRLYRISKIKTVEDTSKTFQKNYDIEDFIKDIQTPFPQYKPQYRKHLVDVQVEVNSAKAYFFKVKQHLKSQKIIETKENGNLIVGFQVTQEMELESLIKSWLPHIKVISPVSLKEKIESELRSYLE